MKCGRFHRELDLELVGVLPFTLVKNWERERDACGGAWSWATVAGECIVILAVAVRRLDSTLTIAGATRRCGEV